MVILLLIMYIFCVCCFATFLIVRRILRNLEEGEITRLEKALHSLRMNVFLLCFLFTPYLIFLETVSFSIGSYDDFINDVFSQSTSVLSSVFLVFTVLINLAIGYSMNPRETVAPERDRWLILMVFLLSVAGILGIVTGVLI